MTSKDQDNHFVEWLQGQIEARRWTMQTLAEEAGIAQATLWNILNRKRAAGPEVLRALAGTLGVSQVEIFAKAGLIDEDWLKEDRLVLAEIRRGLSKIEDDDERENTIRLMGVIVNEVAARSRIAKAGKPKPKGKANLASGET